MLRLSRILPVVKATDYRVRLPMSKVLNEGEAEEKTLEKNLLKVGK